MRYSLKYVKYGHELTNYPPMKVLYFYVVVAHVRMDESALAVGLGGSQGARLGFVDVHRKSSKILANIKKITNKKSGKKE